jgi:hypothetical protein
VQVDSIKPRVESAPGVCNQRLKLKCDEPLSNVAINFNVRRYSVGAGLAEDVVHLVVSAQVEMESNV